MPDYTVTIAGAERHDGESPYLYAVTAETPEHAANAAMGAHWNGTDDTDVIVTDISPGVAVVGRVNDLRPVASNLTDLLAAYDEWAAVRMEVVDSELNGENIGDALANSDDAAVDLLHEIVWSVRHDGA